MHPGEPVLVRESEPSLAKKLCKALPYLAMVVISLFLYYQADNLEFSESSGRIGPGAWPKIVLCLLMLTACLGIIKAIWARQAEPDKQEAADADIAAVLTPPEIYPAMVWVAVAITAAYVLALPILGFFIATIFYSIALMWVGRQRRVAVLCIAGLGFASFFMFLFMKVVYVSLPIGQEPFSAVSLALMALMGIH
ncbi:MAG: tripartite tricarboxylate transporter TctB family protein [Candidimonas sp.]|nr:MAG: tripartite tricarboxylate transporter TctB family protein [Candidimonas sp.]TAM25564.1 MAG: tripartite tricarboxylate transporter TctB family protein [Candidimonas sp.]